MNTKKICVIKNILAAVAIFTLVIIMYAPQADASRYVRYDFRESIMMLNEKYNDTNISITGVNVTGFICASEGCGSVSGTLWGGQTLNSGDKDYIVLEFPTADNSVETYGYGVYLYKDGYIPWEQNPKYWGTGTETKENPMGPYTKYLTKKEKCIAPINSLTVVNDVKPNIPLIINVNASLDATTYSAIESAGPLEYVPPAIANQYSVKTTVTARVYNSANGIVFEEQQDVLIPYSGSKVVEFTWTPSATGTYRIEAISEATDAKCLSTEAQTAKKENINVYSDEPNNECYTILNGLAASDPFPEMNEAITISYNKISNFGNASYELTPTETYVTYTITNSNSDVVFSDTKTLPANADEFSPETFSFGWTPQDQGDYLVGVSAISQSSLCDGLLNPWANETIEVNVLDTKPPVILSLLPSGEIHTSTFNLVATTNEAATCKYDTTDNNYESMANTFATTGGTAHSQPLSLADGSYAYYVRCKDINGNKNTESSSTTFNIDTQPHISIEFQNVSVNHEETFTLTATLENDGYSTADGTIAISVPERLTLVKGNATEPISLANGTSKAFSWDINAAWWGDYIIDIAVDYNGKQETAHVYVQSRPIPIYEYRIASPDSVVVGDTVQVAVGIYNRGVVDGKNVPVSITTSSNLQVNGTSSLIIPVVDANSTQQNATWVEFYVKGLNAGTGTITINAGGTEQQKSIKIKDTHLFIDLSVSAIGPFNMSLGRAFVVSAVVYNTGEATANAVQAQVSMDGGISTKSENPVYLGDIKPTVNGVPPVKREWIVNSTTPGLKQINMSVISLYDTRYNASDSMVIRILDFTEPVSPYLSIGISAPLVIEYGKTFNVAAEITNIGTDSSLGTTALLSGIDGLTILSTNPVILGNIAVDESRNAVWTVNASKKGAYNGVVSANDAGHNFSGTFALSVNYAHDVGLNGLNAPSTAVAGAPVSVSSLLENLGMNNETGINVTLFVDGSATSKKAYDLNASNSTPVSFSWTAVEGTHNLSLASEMEGDLDDSNNNVSGTITVTAQPPPPPSGGGGGGGGHHHDGGGSVVIVNTPNETEEPEVTEPVFSGPAPQEIAVDIRSIKTESTIFANTNTTIGAEIELSSPGSVEVTLLINGVHAEKKISTIINTGTINFTHAFKKTGENNITIIAALAGGRDEMTKTVTVVEGPPTGLFFRMLYDPVNWAIVAMILLVAGIYLKREQIRLMLGLSTGAK